jgi:hypothetical protein
VGVTIVITYSRPHSLGDVSTQFPFAWARVRIKVESQTARASVHVAARLCSVSSSPFEAAGRSSKSRLWAATRVQRAG